MKPEQIVIFNIGEERFALPIMNIREIITTEELQPITSDKEEVSGMVMIRSVLVPIINLRLLLKKEKIEKTKRQRIITIMAEGDKKIGLLVDNVLSVTRTNHMEYAKAPTEAHAIIKGILKDENTVTYLMDEKQIGGEC